MTGEKTGDPTVFRKARILAAAVSIAIAALAATPAPAHEFWIEPESGEINPGESIVADLKVGTMLNGESYPYLSNRFVAFTDTVGGETSVIVGNDGDIPAMVKIAARPGLHVIANQTVAFRLTYDDWSKFRGYLAYEGLDQFADLHRKRGLPESGFAERYIRYAKAVVQVGPVAASDADVRIGMPFELIAEDNPYSPTVQLLRVSLIWRGIPAANHQISIFRKDGVVTRTTAITDAAGRASIPLPGDGEYLLNAVHLEPVDAAPVVWESHWASMSFKLRRGVKSQ
jgi:uncharacterized GH25 family protein